MLIPEIQLNFLHSDFSEAGMNSLADANLGVIGGSTQFSLDGVVSSAKFQILAKFSQRR